MAKAYDSIDRSRALLVFEHMGLTQCPLFNFVWDATVRGSMCTTGGEGMGEPFGTTRGIRQGCPASPVLFALLLSAAERALADRLPKAGVTVGHEQAVMTSYADDVKLICTSAAELEQVYKGLTDFLGLLGLHSDTGKCNLLVVA